MTQEQKELLLKDLCARLPYGVKCCIYNFGENTIRIKEDRLWSVQGDNILTLKSCVEKGEAYMYHQIKPYLFPLSSMTDEQKKKYHLLCNRIIVDTEFGDAESIYCDTYQSIDYLIENHFDYRGLIPKGLAIDATGLNIY
jgi:hypothetical protein